MSNIISKRSSHSDYLTRNYYINKLVNHLMYDGKKSASEDIVFKAFSELKLLSGYDSNFISIFYAAIENVKPFVEIRSLRLAGSTYQVPVEISPKKQVFYALKWIVECSRNRKEKTMSLRLAHELYDASCGKGSSVEKKEVVHKMAEANRAFVYYRW